MVIVAHCTVVTQYKEKTVQKCLMNWETELLRDENGQGY